MDGRRVMLTPGTTLRFGSLDRIYTGPVESVAGRTFGRPPRPNVLSRAAAREAFVRSYSGNVITYMLGPNPTQERFMLTAYYLTDLSFQASRDGPLDWGEFMERYSTMYPHGQPGLPDDPLTAYVDSLCATSIVPESATTQRRRPRDVTTPQGNATFAWLLRQAAPNQSMHHAIVVPMPSGGPDSMS
jgi:hypothetical protein